jgi:hypothetical protein
MDPAGTGEGRARSSSTGSGSRSANSAWQVGQVARWASNECCSAGVRPPEPVVVLLGHDTTPLSLSAVRRALRAAKVRVFTVPSGMPRCAAISDWLIWR